MLLDRLSCDRARRSRDARFDGRFFIGVTTTRVYCRPICPARAPNDAHVRYFPTAAAAQAAGFRPCLRCRPEASPGTPAWLGTSSVVSRGLRLIGEGALDHDSVEQLAARLGVTDRHLRRLFLQHLGATPIEVALTRRVHFAKKLLDETTLPCSQVALAAGFGSVRRFNGEIRRTYSRTPTELRKLSGRRTGMVEPAFDFAQARQGLTPPDGASYRFRLSYRPPYDWDAVLQFLRARAIPGVEAVDDTRYRRTIAIDGKSGTLVVAHSASRPHFDLEVRVPNPRPLLFVVERVRRILDLGADPLVIAAHLGSDPLLKGPLRTHPGVRMPGAWDGFELAVRAIVGQQISVRAASTITGRIARMFGAVVDAGEGLDRLFPTPAQLADAPIERAGVIAARAGAIRGLARRVVDGSITFDAAGDPDAVVRALKTIPGLGDWTAQYIAMRALGEPDAFPSSDLVLRRMAGGCTRRELDRLAESWRPWRAYAVMLLWSTAIDVGRSLNPEHHLNCRSRPPRMAANAQTRCRHPERDAGNRTSLAGLRRT